MFDTTNLGIKQLFHQRLRSSSFSICLNSSLFVIHSNWPFLGLSVCKAMLMPEQQLPYKKFTATPCPSCYPRWSDHENISARISSLKESQLNIIFYLGLASWSECYLRSTGQALILTPLLEIYKIKV